MKIKYSFLFMGLICGLSLFSCGENVRNPIVFINNNTDARILILEFVPVNFSDSVIYNSSGINYVATPME